MHSYADGFSFSWMGGTRTVFSGVAASGSNLALVASNQAGHLHTIATTSTTTVTTKGARTFEQLSDVSASATSTAYVGVTKASAGIYVAQGADVTTAVVETGTASGFSSVSNPTLDMTGKHLAFQGTLRQGGHLRGRGGRRGDHPRRNIAAGARGRRRDAAVPRQPSRRRRRHGRLLWLVVQRRAAHGGQDSDAPHRPRLAARAARLGVQPPCGHLPGVDGRRRRQHAARRGGPAHGRAGRREGRDLHRLLRPGRGRRHRRFRRLDQRGATGGLRLRAGERDASPRRQHGDGGARRGRGRLRRLPLSASGLGQHDRLLRRGGRSTVGHLRPPPDGPGRRAGGGDHAGRFAQWRRAHLLPRLGRAGDRRLFSRLLRRHQQRRRRVFGEAAVQGVGTPRAFLPSPVPGS